MRPSPPYTRLLGLTVVLVLSLWSPLPASAADGPALSLSGPTAVAAGGSATVVATLTQDGGPVAAASVRLLRVTGDGTTVEGTGSTDGAGQVSFTVAVPTDSTFRAVRDDGTGELTSLDLLVRAATPTSLVLRAPASGVVDSRQTVAAVLSRQDGAGVAGETLRFQRRVSGAWQAAGQAVTDSEGRASVSVDIRPTQADNTFRAAFEGRFDEDAGTEDLLGATSAVAVVEPRRRDTTLSVTGPSRIVDETSETLRLRWLADNGDAVPGSVTVWRRLAGGDWRRYTTLTTGGDGLASVSVSPRVDSRWKAVGAVGRWWQGDTSGVHALDNVPPGSPVAYPAGAPKPALRLPAQARAQGAGPNPTVAGISGAMWRSMVGRSWHRGCPVGRAQLRVVRVNYWAYNGYRRRGEIVVRDAIAGRTAQVFSAIYRAGLPIRAMYRVDRFGWSSRLRGADDYRSMRAGNTSGFNCRGVVGNPSVRSPHSYGRSIDINPWENPYRSRQGWTPNTWWVSRSHPRIAWRSTSHQMVQIMADHGFRWTYGRFDAHHFDG